MNTMKLYKFSHDYSQPHFAKIAGTRHDFTIESFSLPDSTHATNSAAIWVTTTDGKGTRIGQFQFSETFNRHADVLSAWSHGFSLIGARDFISKSLQDFADTLTVLGTLETLPEEANETRSKRAIPGPAIPQ